ncbi:MAG: cytochrome C [Alphaproteobacteria bacterium PA4]|nr:MAG: cytochrome C [Alphaproteobacteria bacterium PA4]
MKLLFPLMALAAAPALAAPPAAPHPGEKVYREVCQACHMANAKGAVGAGRIASLAANPNLSYPEYPITIVTGGKGPMPWFRGDLSDQEIADVIGYVRTHFGNNYKAKVTVADVAKYGVKAPERGER